jgi:hypothetical protein
MSAKIATMRNRRYNTYVPAAQYANDVTHTAPYKVLFGAPAAAAAANILSAQSIAVATNTIALGVSLLSDTADAPFGRTLTYIASGAATSTVTVSGKDYLGQPMVETITLTGAVSVVGLKAFAWIDSIAWGLTAATTINVGWGARLGLPYKASNVLAETANGGAATLGTLTAAILTDPQTAITGDPRGTYTPNTAFNATNVIEATFLWSNQMNASGNGGLYGIKHFTP